MTGPDYFVANPDDESGKIELVVEQSPEDENSVRLSFPFMGEYFDEDDYSGDTEVWYELYPDEVQRLSDFLQWWIHNRLDKERTVDDV